MSFNDASSSFNSGSFNNNSYQNYRPTPQHEEQDEFKVAHSVVVQNIQQLTQNFTTISTLAQDIGTAKDTGTSRESLKSLLNRNSILIKETTNHLNKLSNLVGVDPRKRAERKIVVEKYNQDFSKFIETYTSLANITKGKMEDFPIRGGGGSNNPFDDGSYNPYQEQQNQQRMAMLSRLEADREFQDALIHDRDNEIRHIQAQMLEINEIFKNVATLVDEQGELVDDIRSNISDTNSNVIIAVHEVTEAEKLQEGTRNKLLWLAGCCAVLIIAVVVIVVVVVQMRQKS